MNNNINSIGICKTFRHNCSCCNVRWSRLSTVAGMMKKEGYKVIGITLKLYDDGKEVAASKNVVQDKTLWTLNV